MPTRCLVDKCQHIWLTIHYIYFIGVSRGFAFMEFYSTDDAVKWMADNRVRELAENNKRTILPTIEQLCTIVANRTHSHCMDILWTWNLVNARMIGVMMTIIIVVVTIMIVMATDTIKQMRGITLMPLLTVSATHAFNCNLHMHVYDLFSNRYYH